MSSLKPLVRLIVLAGRSARDEALADRFAVSHKCFVPLAGKPLIAHVLQTAAAHPRIDSLAVSIEPHVFEPIYDLLTGLSGRGTVQLIEAQATLGQSIEAAAKGWDGHLLITTADHALLSDEAIDAMIDGLDQADLAMAMVPRERVMMVHPAAHQHFHVFTDGAFADCNLYAVSGGQGLRAAGLFGGRPGPLKRLWRLWSIFGLFYGVLVALRLVALEQASTRASRHMGCRVRAVVLQDGAQAIDVDDDRTYAIVSDLMARQGMPDTPVQRGRAVA